MSQNTNHQTVVMEAASKLGQDLPRLQPKLTMMGREDCLRLHSASCKILRETGVVVHSEAGIELLRKAGAVIDGELAKIPSSLVEWALASAPAAFTLYKRGTEEPAVILDGEHVYFGPGSDTLHYLDPRSGTRRDFQSADLTDCMHVADACPEIGFVMSSGVPRDVPPEYCYQHQFAIMLRSTTKPIVVVCDGLADIDAIRKMAAAAAGGDEQLVKYPTLLVYSEPSTPLQHSTAAIEKLLYCSEHSIPITHSPAPMMGGTAPVTLAGAVVLGNAEMLSGLVMHQLQNPGAPFLYGHGVHHLDMKTMVSVYGAPEYQLARVMAAEMGHFYRLPVWGYAGHSDSKVLDGQAAVDSQFAVLVALMAKTNLNHDVGYLESGLTHSPELMVLTNEIISQSRKFVEGIRFDDEAMGVDVIQKVGPGGNFTSTQHTRKFWRDLWVPQIFDRQHLDRWEEQGSKDVETRIREKTIALMDQHTVEPLPAAVDQAIDAILRH
jgi:trimethylamine---corrinoid protein Co-methyltransferase